MRPKMRGQVHREAQEKKTGPGLSLGRDKKEAARKGRLQFGRWLVRLEEDHTADLEDLEIVEAGAQPLAEVLVGLTRGKDFFLKLGCRYGAAT